jgi:hypothetical protein
MTLNGWRHLVVVVSMLLCMASGSSARADDLQAQAGTCATASDTDPSGTDIWQQALDLDGGAKAAAQTGPSLCLDPTQTQVAGGCCSGHGGPAGCDADTHKVICADGKKSKSCGC